MELVSVIMPCYNDGAYLEDSINSLRAQTWMNWELILIDDGSDQPETVQRLQELADVPYIRILHTDHVGPSGARNKGIGEARGEYILPLDADDTIHPTYMEKAVGILREKARVGIVYCRADFFGERSGPWELPDYSLHSMLQDNVIFVTAMFRRKDWEEVGGFNLCMQDGMEDYDFWLSLLEHDKTVVQLPETLFHYRIKPVSRTTRFQKSVQQVKDTYHKIYFNHTVLYEKYREIYDISMRDTMIDLIEQRRVLENEVARLNRELEEQQRINRVPLWKRFIRHYILRRRETV